jgi:DNA-binding transcriptional MerR regulator
MVETEPGLRVQEVAARTGLSVHTLRYYERAGLIPSIQRDASSGHRRYNEGDVMAIEFLKRLRMTGMPIREMQRYVALVRKGDATLDERRQMLEAHGAVVRRQIDDLQTCLAAIEYKVASYTRLGSIDPLAGPCKTERKGIK